MKLSILINILVGLSKLSAMFVLGIILVACGGGGSSSSNSGGGTTPTPTPTPTTIQLFELIDPTPGTNDGFGSEVTVLANGNIVVTDPSDSSVVNDNGAVHLYNGQTRALITSFYGMSENDFINSSLVTALGDNFILSLAGFDFNGIQNAGSVRLINGSTGAQIGSHFTGDTVSDAIGRHITVLTNGNFVIGSPRDDVGGLVNAGSITLVDGITGLSIATIVGDEENDGLGAASFRSGIFALPNGNFVIGSPEDSDIINNVDRAGSVRLVNGATGAQINILVGDNPEDRFGTTITPLPNSNFVVSSFLDDVGGLTNAGSVALIDGITGTLIGSAINGDNANDLLGGDAEGGSVRVLANGNYVIVSLRDDNGGVTDVGSIIVVDGDTGTQLGSTFYGSATDDSLGSGEVVGLPNSNIVVASPELDVTGLNNAGSVSLVDGATGTIINTLNGDMADDLLGGRLFGNSSTTAVVALANNNFVVHSPFDNDGGLRLISGATGQQIGNLLTNSTLATSQTAFTPSTQLATLSTGNFVVVDPDSDSSGMIDAGFIQVFDGSTGTAIGSAITGDMEGDRLGFDSLFDSIIVLDNDNIVVSSFHDDQNGIEDAGSILFLNGQTGSLISEPVAGEATLDFIAANIIPAASANTVVAGLRRADSNGLDDAGRVFILSLSN